MSDFFSIGHLAASSLCSVETIRFYEKKGLILPIGRTSGGFRQYDNASLRRLSFISRSKELGFSLREIGELLRIHEDDGVQCESVLTRSEEKLADIRIKIQNLKTIENALIQLNEACSNRVSEICPILSFLDAELICSSSNKKKTSE